MPIVNASKETVLADSFEEARTFWEQSKGLMFRKVVPLLFRFDKEQNVSLHSWFCDSMDLVFLNDEWEVVELFREWSAWSTYSSKNKASLLIELPAGTIFDSRTDIGDIIHLK